MYVIVVLISALTLFSGCYKLSPEGEDLRTVPVTNNPHIYPGYQRPSSVPQMEY